MTNTGTIADLIEKAIAVEQGSEEFYRRLAAMFSEQQDVVRFWQRYADEEKGHAAYLVRMRERMTAEQLQGAADTYMLEVMRKSLEYNLDQMLDRIRTLEDAYQLVVELENSETNSIFEALITNFSAAELAKSNAFLRVQLKRHIAALQEEFPARYQSRMMRESVKARLPSAA